MVSHADVRVSRVSHGDDRDGGAFFRADAPRRTRRALDAAAGVVPCGDPDFECLGTYGGNDSGAHCGRRDVPASGAGILFFAVSIDRFDLADSEAAKYRGFRLSASGFREAALKKTGSREPEAGRRALL